jgi:hypothetical protein
MEHLDRAPERALGLVVAILHSLRFTQSIPSVHQPGGVGRIQRADRRDRQPELLLRFRVLTEVVEKGADLPATGSNLGTPIALPGDPDAKRAAFQCQRIGPTALVVPYRGERAHIGG